MPGYNPPTPASIGAVPITRQVIAGSNLTGGGALSSDVTLNGSGGGGAAIGQMPIVLNASGKYVCNRINAAPSTTYNTIADRLAIVPFVPSRNLTINEVAIEVQSAGTGLRAGIWNSNADGTPNALLADSGLLSGTTTGVKNAAISNLNLVAGTPYWLGILFQTATTVTALSQANSLAFTSDTNSSTLSPNVLLMISSFASGLPSPLSFASFTSLNTPALWFRMKIA